MAGLYDQIQPTSEEKLSVHLFMAVLVLRAEGAINDSQARTILDDQIGTPLAGASLADANAILAALNGKATVEDKMRYFLKVDAACQAVEQGASIATDGAWRSICEI